MGDGGAGKLSRTLVFAKEADAAAAARSLAASKADHEGTRPWLLFGLIFRSMMVVTELGRTLGF